MSAAVYDRPATFRIGKVLGDTFSTLGRNFGLYFGLSLVFSGLPSFLFQLAGGSWLGMSWLLLIVSYLVYTALMSLLQAALTRAAIQDLNGQQPTFRDALDRGLRLALPVVGLSIVAWLGIGVGCLALIAPGIYLMVGWWIAVPVLVQERRGIIESMTRSSDLTDGNRWRMFALLLVTVVTVWILQMALWYLSIVMTPLLGLVLADAVEAFFSSILSAFVSIAAAVSYVELRYVKEGTDISELAEIFS